MQAERDVGNSIILHWRANEIENVVAPLNTNENTVFGTVSGVAGSVVIGGGGGN